MDNDNHQETDYDALEQKEAVRKFVEDRVAKYIVSRSGREADQLPPAPVAEEIISTLDVSQVQVGEKLYTHPQPAIDVDALAEFIKDTYPISWERGSHKLAEQICNWIEEQQK